MNDHPNRRHGHSYVNGSRNGTPTYRTWASMIERCTNPTRRSFADYGARGITVCDRWRESFEHFLADMGERPLGTTIDRIDGSLGYDASNCRWATRIEQESNKRSSRFVEYLGKRVTVSAFARAIGQPIWKVHQRVGRGWPVEKIVSKP